MSDSLELLQQTLKHHGQSLTQPRIMVFTAMQGQEPMSMQGLVESCDTIDRASVYRTVAVFEKLGIVQRLQIGWKYKLELSDDFHEHHHHLTCEHCGKTFAIPEDIELEARLQAFADDQSFQMKSHQLEIRGLCAACSS